MIKLAYFLTFCLLLSLVGCERNSNGEKQENKFDEKNSISIDNISSLIGKDFLIDDQHSYIGFRIKYFGTSNVRGRFDKFNGTAFYDSTSGFISVSLNIDANSINTG